MTDRYTIAELISAAAELKYFLSSRALPAIAREADRSRAAEGGEESGDEPPQVFTEEQIRNVLAAVGNSTAYANTIIGRLKQGEYENGAVYRTYGGTLYRCMGDHFLTFGSTHKYDPATLGKLTKIE